VPEAAAKTIALYLMLAIGFKGGAEVAKSGLTGAMAGTIAAGTLLSLAIPVIGYAALRAVSRLPVADAAAISAHYGSISIVTFVAATETLRSQDVPSEGFMVAVAAVMEAPAILSALLIARRAGAMAGGEGIGALLREVGLNASVVTLAGAFLIGWATGERGLAMIGGSSSIRSAACCACSCSTWGCSPAAACATASSTCRCRCWPSASPCRWCRPRWPRCSPGRSACRRAARCSSSRWPRRPRTSRCRRRCAWRVPQAKPAIYLTLSLGVTFPFNLAVGLPLYLAVASRLTGAP
jgi:hypothetical protein